MPELDLQQPAWLLLWPVGLLLAWRLRRRLRLLSVAALFGAQVAWRHPALARLAADTASGPAGGRVLIPLLTWSCLLLALAQPVRLGEPLPAPRPAVDLYVLLDTSVSMVLRDYRQDDRPVERLTFAKGLLDHLAAGYGGDRLALYLLGSPSRRLLPPSPDHDLFRHTLARVEPVLAGRRAELGDALARLATDIAAAPAGRQTIALLVTDGTQPSGTLAPQAGAERLREAGVPLYILSVGAGQDTGQASGGLLFGGARPAQLEQLAELTGGRSFAAADSQALQAAMRTLTERHLSRSAPPPARREPLYPWLLLAALLLPMLPAIPLRGEGAP
jgi:Ca-activated chloride channel family protein